MGRHRDWRRIAKRERRRKIRTQWAKSRDCTLDCNSAEYQDLIKEEEELELFELEQIDRSNLVENGKWLRAERFAMEQWRKLQEQKEKLRIQHLEEEAKRRLEWEFEQENKRKEEERLKEIEEENKRKQEFFMKHLEEFLAGDNSTPPEELLLSRETKPDCDLCPFFSKTACCRFGDQCSRNHKFPGISKVLLATNFYSHFGLDNADEHDTDIMLEYEDSDTYREFKDFFNDVLPEFEKFGRITQFKEYSERSRRTPPRSWRWSESPEVELSRRCSRSSERRDRRREERDSREESRRERKDRQERSRRIKTRRTRNDKDSQRVDRLKETDSRYDKNEGRYGRSRREDRHERDMEKGDSRYESRKE